MAFHFLYVVLPLGLFLGMQVSGLGAPSIAKPSCAEECGGVAIPFPFGIGQGCFLDEWYEMECRNRSTPSVPVLKKTSLRVLDISFSGYIDAMPGLIKVKYPIISNASCAGNGTSIPVSLKGSPFSFYDSSLTVVGCNVHVSAHIRGGELGCWSGCGENYTANQNGTCLDEDRCCQIVLPSYTQEFKVDFTEGVGDNCSYALLADVYSMQSRSLEDAFARKSLTVSLSWGISKNTSLADRLCPFSNYYTCWGSGIGSRCKNLRDLGIVSCSCNYDYPGNPYLKGGCIGGVPSLVYQRRPTYMRGRRLRVEFPRSIRHWYSSGWGGKWMGPVKAIGTSLGGILLLSFIWWQFKFIQKWRDMTIKKKNFKRNGGLLLEQQLNSPEGSLEKSKVFTSKELEIATENFNKSRILGHGGQGTVYKGMLTDGQIVAVKRSTVVDEGKLEQFISEVVILSLINHRNIVNLLGCCLETEVPLLVYEFIPNGTLYRYLHDPNEEYPLTWEVRLRIAAEVAGALAYLHSAASLPIFHRDIKSSNILLDEKYRAKVADFGTSKSVSLDQTHVTTLVQGTFGYLDPEYFQSSQLTDKSDVYSFGIVLVELLTGQKPVSSTEKREERSLAMYFIVSMEENLLFEILDPEVMKQGGEEDISRVALVAKRCLHLNGRNRPSMKEVSSELEEVRNIAFPSMVLQNQGSNIGVVTENHDDFSADESDDDSEGIEPSVDEQRLSVTMN